MGWHTSLSSYAYPAFSSRPTHASAVLAMIREATGRNYAEGGYHDAKFYAFAKAADRLLETIDRTNFQARPDRAFDLLPALEELYRITAPVGASLLDRRDAVAVAMRRILSTAKQAVEAALTDALGSDFLAFLPVPTAAIDLFPADPGASVVGLFVKPGSARKTWSTLSHVFSPGVATVTIQKAVAGTEALLVGDLVIVEPENLNLAERVTVTAVTSSSFTATFTKPHNVGATVSTAPWPLWVSTKRHANVLVTTAAATDANKRRLIHNVMRRYARIVSTWNITDNAVDPFTLDQSLMDAAMFNN